MNIRGQLGTLVVLALAILAMCIVLPIVMLVFAVAFLWHEPRIPVGIGLYMLAVTAIDSAVGGHTIVEQLATVAYACLALGVALLSVRLVGARFNKAMDTD